MLAGIRAHQKCLRSIPTAHRLRQIYISRNISGSALHPVIRTFAASLAQTQPCFRVSASQIRLIFQPPHFYETLLDMIRRARKRIFISSLYIGSSETELIEAIHSSLARTPDLHVHLQLDLNRSTRPGPSSTALLLLPLLRDFPERVHVSLFRSPKLKGLMARLVPPRFNEGWGTWHAKIYGADDDVIISGANLSKSYFTDRQDRYMHFSSTHSLAEYCLSYLKTASAFSYYLNAPLSSHSSNVTPEAIWPNASIHPHHTERAVHTAFSDLQKSHRQETKSFMDSRGDDEVLVFPIIQAGQFGVREEERCLHTLFEHLSAETNSKETYARPLMDITSGYFGLYKPYQDLVLNAPINTRIICASPKANGFYGSQGVSGRIPEGYTLLEQRFMKAVRSTRRAIADHGEDSNVELNEWQRDGWTYHAKGIWLSPSTNSAPVLTLIGSTNLNSRSSHLDTELSFMMLTSSPALRQKLQEEVTGLGAYSEPWKGDQREVRWGTKAIVGVVGGML